MKFIHAADIHLDSPLKGLSAYPEAPADQLRNASREALQGLVGRAIEESVDFMVIAGDIFDGTWRDFHTGLFFVRQMGRLRERGIPVYILYGNHDAESEMTRSLQWPDNVHCFPSDKAGTFRLEDKRVALHGRSFKVAATTENLAVGYPPPVPGWLNIGVLHTALEGSSAHARYAPCSLAELEAKGYQYWALGHVHEHWMQRGEVTIAYPGNLQGRHIREAGPRGALLVKTGDQEVRDVRRLEVDVLRWHLLEVDLSEARDFEAALRAVGTSLGQALDATPSRLPLAVRVLLKGRTTAHASLSACGGQLRLEVIAQALALDPERLWIEKVLLETVSPDAVSASLPEDLDGALSILRGLALDPSGEPELLAALVGAWKALLDKLPQEVYQAYPDLWELSRNPGDQAPVRLQHALSLLLGRFTRDAGTVG